MNHIRLLGLALVSIYLTACGPAIPSNAEIAEILREPVLSSVTYSGADLPREAVEIEKFEILQLEVKEIGDEKRLEVAGTADIRLTRSGNEIQGMIGDGGDGGIGALLEMQKFVRALGNTLQKGKTLSYYYSATLAEQQDKSYRIVEGTVREL